MRPDRTRPLEKLFLTVDEAAAKTRVPAWEIREMLRLGIVGGHGNGFYGRKVKSADLPKIKKLTRFEEVVA